jgi:hypothetical protein
MCSKQCYDKKTAKTILNERKDKGRKWSREKRIYFCEKCNSWHLTSEDEYEPRIQLKEEDLIFKSKWKELKKP